LTIAIEKSETASALPRHVGWVGARRALSYHLFRYRRTWRGTVIISIVNPLLFLLAIGLGLGRVVGNHAASLHGTSYLAFFAPGMLAAAAMQNGIIESAFPVSRATAPGGSYAVAKTSPLDPTDIMVGHLLFMTLRIAMSATAFVAIMAALGATRSLSALLTIPAATLTGLAFAAPTAAWAARTANPQTVGKLFKWVVMPLYLFSGTFFPVSQLPPVLRDVAYATPLWHGVQLCRSLSLGTATLPAALGHVAYLARCAVVGVVVARRTYRRRLYV
jgi:lipooligosaccharide transport system permease protein